MGLENTALLWSTFARVAEQRGSDSHVQLTLVGVDAKFYIRTNVFAVDSGVRG